MKGDRVRNKECDKGAGVVLAADLFVRGGTKPGGCDGIIDSGQGSVQRVLSKSQKAGERTRTVDIQLGRLTLYH